MRLKSIFQLNSRLGPVWMKAKLPFFCTNLLLFELLYLLGVRQNKVSNRLFGQLSAKERTCMVQRTIDRFIG